MLVTASVVAGARLLAGADDTARVWALVHAEGAGAHLGSADLAVRRVRFADAGDLDLYYSADEALPADLVLDHTVGAGELLARSAVAAPGESDTVRVSIEVDPGLVDPEVHAGSVVDVYLDDKSATGSGPSDDGRALSGVTVLAAPAYDQTYAVTGDRQLVLAVPTGQVDRFERTRAAMQAPEINVNVH
ncbi:MAG TPA: hypothetical protein VN088_15845 [Nocardioides sp.]|nr:hypothetical protein [Nocardioides sp.]